MWTTRIANLFLALFAADALLSTADDLLFLNEASVIRDPRNALAGVAILAGFIVALLMPLTRMLPLRVFLPPVVFVVWVAMGAFPMFVLHEPGSTALSYVSLAQLVTSATAFLMVRFTLGGSRWLVGPPTAEAARFRPARAVALYGLALLSLPFLLAGTLLTAGVNELRTMTAGFTGIDSTGIHIVDRTYERDDKHVRLIGMIHIGEGATYASLLSSFDEPGTVVLEEGVSDREGLITAPLPYDGLAEPLGLLTQSAARVARERERELARDDESEWPHVRHPDVDVSELRPETLAYIATTSEAMERFSDGDYAGFFAVLSRPDADNDHAAVFFEDILAVRDQHIIEALEAALDDYDRIVVPWGALHQNALSAQVETWGFRQVREERHLAISWRAVFGALFR